LQWEDVKYDFCIMSESAGEKTACGLIRAIMSGLASLSQHGSAVADSLT